MKTVEEIEQEIRALPIPDFARVSAWLAKYDATIRDKQMEKDSASGRLDFLFEESKSEWMMASSRFGLVRMTNTIPC